MGNPENMSTGSSGIGRTGTGRRRRAFVFALLVLAFAAFYPYMEARGSCGEPGCPEFSHAHSPAPAELPQGALVAMLAAVPTLAGRGAKLLPASDRRPTEVYLSPDPEPPRP